MIHLNTFKLIHWNIVDLNNAQFSENLLYGTEDFYKVNNTRVMDAAISYLIKTERFDAQDLTRKIEFLKR